MRVTAVWRSISTTLTTVHRGFRDAAPRRVFLIGLLALASGSLAGCLAPTLPLPPPSAPLVTTPDPAGFVRVTGRVQSHASVYILNTSTNKGVNQWTEEDGRYDLELRAEIGDRLNVWQKVGTHESDYVEVVVPASTPIDNIPPPPPGLGGARSD